MNQEKSRLIIIKLKKRKNDLQEKIYTIFKMSDNIGQKTKAKEAESSKANKAQ